MHAVALTLRGGCAPGEAAQPRPTVAMLHSALAVASLLAVQLDTVAAFGDQCSEASSVRWFLVDFLLGFKSHIWFVIHTAQLSSENSFPVF